uniref:L-2-hydroxyglutarate dehydrogenase, mitochondrial n=1 Tax=Onchocerca volvulus TaxID=6282 RepID=A0A8R1TXG3_ONCVO
MNFIAFRLLTVSRIPSDFCASILSRNRGVASTATGSATSEFDVVVVGGGVIGCSTARQLKINNPELKVALLEKENHLAFHQSGHNSGVLHAGIYYAPGSLKAKLCVRGIDLAYEYCDKHKVPYKKIGKLIVAVEPIEVPRLENLFERAQKNGCKSIKMVDGSEIKNYAPFCKVIQDIFLRNLSICDVSKFGFSKNKGCITLHAQGLKALWSPYTGIIDWGLVTKSYAQDFKNRGGVVYTKYPLKTLLFVGESSKENVVNNYPVMIESEPSLPKIRCKYIITCCGLQSDHIAKLSGGTADPKIVPFRGEYLLLTSESKKKLVTTNVYPVPDPRLPFLGVHFTPRMNGDVWLGPNAVLAYKREGYKYSQISLFDLYDTLTYRGTRKLIVKFFGYGMKELYRGIWIRAQVKQLQRFMPDLSISDVIRGPAGVRAQALDSNGNLVDDFIFDCGQGELSQYVLHVRNAPSPGATSSLAIAEMIYEKASTRFGLKHQV